MKVSCQEVWYRLGWHYWLLCWGTCSVVFSRAPAVGGAKRKYSAVGPSFVADEPSPSACRGIAMWYLTSARMSLNFALSHCCWRNSSRSSFEIGLMRTGFSHEGFGLIGVDSCRRRLSWVLLCSWRFRIELLTTVERSFIAGLLLCYLVG